MSENNEIKSVDAFSMDLEKMNKEKLKTIFPECFVEDKLDIDKLLGLCGEYIIEYTERYNFEWKGKSECLQLAQKRSMGALRPCKEESVDFDNTQNIYIEGDNLEVLKLLQVSYFNKVKMIYIDPPYNTGHDFVYEDDYRDPIERYKEVTSQATKSNPETMGRFHTKWLNMMYPRLRLATNLLKDDGVIFISIDDNEVHNLRKLCDETFGEENFVGIIIWKNATDNNPTRIAMEHEYILCYAKYKNIVEAVWKAKTSSIKDILINVGNELNKQFNNSEQVQHAYDIWYKKNKFQLSPLDRYKYIDKGGIFTGSQSVHNPGREGYRYDIIHPITKKPCIQPLLGYRFPEETMKNLISEGKIIFGEDHNKIVELKVYAKDYEEKFSSVFELDGRLGSYDLKNIFGKKPIFTNPKPIQLIKRLLSFITSKDDIVLDFFSGSAGIGHAIMQLNAEDGGNRQFILVQLPELCDENSEAYQAGYKNICEIGKERIRRAGKKILEENSQLKLEERETPLDVGFKVFKLDTSNLNEWNSIPINDDLGLLDERFDRMLNKIKLDRNQLDVVYEIILKMGFPLSTFVAEIEVSGKKCFIVGEECILLICLEHALTLEDVEAMAKYKPAQLIFSKQSFVDINVMINAHYRIRDIGIEIKLV